MAARAVPIRARRDAANICITRGKLPCVHRLLRDSPGTRSTRHAVGSVTLSQLVQPALINAMPLGALRRSCPDTRRARMALAPDQPAI
jgi:hypothetical protein